MSTAVERWNALLMARAQQMDAAYARLGRTSADFWDRRARRFHHSTKDSVTHDPFFLKVQGEVTAQTHVLDVGAGTGRFALALAPLVQQVIVVEPNANMLNYLRHDAHELAITNITYLETTWQQAPTDIRTDLVICSHVLYPVLDIVPFLTKLQSVTSQACYLYLRATHFDATTNDLWQHFHGTERCLPPSYIHVLDVLYELGIYASVEIVKLPPQPRYATLTEAVEELREQLILPADEQSGNELQGLLEVWLVERDGMLIPPLEEMVSAIVWWTA